MKLLTLNHRTGYYFQESEVGAGKKKSPVGREPSVIVASEREIGRLGDLLSCPVVVASESIERYIEPVSGIYLPNSDMMSRKTAAHFVS